jgi:hypothetical protein
MRARGGLRTGRISGAKRLSSGRIARDFLRWARGRAFGGERGRPGPGVGFTEERTGLPSRVAHHPPHRAG